MIEDAEIYKNKPIFYSLGNFIFDQNFSPETQTGLVIKGEINQNQINLDFSPIRAEHYKPTLLFDNEKLTIINQLRISMGLLPVTNNNPSQITLNR